MIKITPSDGINFQDCCRLLLNSDPWKKLNYGEKEAKQISESSRSGRTWLAVDGNQVVGAAITRPDFLLGEYLKILVVAEHMRSRGIGRDLMEAFEQGAFTRVPNTYLCVSSFNTKAKTFYLSLGYTEIGSLKNLLIPDADEILMRKTKGPRQGWKPSLD